MSSWITFDTTGGTGNTTITITAASSTELNYRIKTLRAETTSHRKTANVVVTQEKYILQLSASTKYLYFSGDTGETQEVCVFSNTAWTATTSENWIHLSKTGSTGEDCFNVTTDGLTGDDIRWGEISITDGQNTVVVFVVQSGDDYHYFIGVFECTGHTLWVYNNTTPDLYNGKDTTIDRNINIRIDKGSWEKIYQNDEYKKLTLGRHVVEYDFSYPSDGSIYNNNKIYDAAFRMPADNENDLPLAFGIVTEGYREIGEAAFGNVFLRKIELRSSVLETIGENAFGKLMAWGIPTIDDDTVEPHGHPASSAGRLREIYIPSSVTTIGMGAFVSCGFRDVVFGQNIQLENIPDECFAYCQNLININLPDGITSIGDDAFCNNISLYSIDIPDSVETIGDMAFGMPIYDSQNPGFGGEVNNLHYVNLTNNSKLSKIGKNAFRWTFIETINIPHYMEEIDERAFEHSELTHFNFPEGVYKVSNNLFKNCSKLRTLTLPKDVSYIEDYAFSGCSSLETIYTYAIDCPIVTDYSTGGSPFMGVKTGGTLYYPTCADYTDWLTRASALGTWNGSSTLPCYGETFRMVPDSFARFNSDAQIQIIEIYTNYEWEATITPVQGNAFSIVPSSGVGSYQVQLFVDSNTGSTERSSLLRVKTAHSDTGNIRLYQDLNINALPVIKVTLNINDTTQPISISSGDTGATIYKYRIDYGEWITKDTASTIDYQFSYNGTHVIEYALKTTTTDSCVLPTDRSLVRGIELDNKITSLSIGFAQNCTNLLTFIMPSAITLIPSACFKNCGALIDHSYVLHSGVTRIDSEAFSHNTFSSSTLNLTNVTSMGTGAFESCSGFSSVIIDHLNTIPDRAFMCCYDLSNVEWKTNCSEIGEYAFYTTALFSNGNKTITLPITGDYNPPTIGAYAFANSVGWSSPDVDVDLRFPVYMSRDRSSTACTIGEGAFSNTYIQSVSFYKVPDSPYNGTPIFAFPTKCFKDCRSLERINVENTNTTISAMSNDTFQNVASNGVLHYKSSYGCSSITNNNPYHLGYYGWTAVRDL